MSGAREIRDDLIARVTEEHRKAGLLPSQVDAEDVVGPVLEKALRRSGERRTAPKATTPAPKDGDVVTGQMADVSFHAEAGRVTPKSGQALPRGKFRPSWITDNLPMRRWPECLRSIPQPRRTQVAFMLWVHCLKEHPDWRPKLEASAWAQLRGLPQYETVVDVVRKSKDALRETWLGRKIGPFVRV